MIFSSAGNVTAGINPPGTVSPERKSSRTFSSEMCCEHGRQRYKRGGIRPAVILIFLTAICGCAHLPMDGQYSGPDTLPVELSREFTHRKFSGEFKERIVESTPRYTLKEITLHAITETRNDFKFSDTHPRKNTPSSSGKAPVVNESVVVSWYHPRGKGAMPVIILLPALAGRNIFTGYFARHYASRGYAALIVHRINRLKNFIGIDRGIRDSVRAVRVVVDWVAAMPELDSGRIGVFGISMGGIEGVFLTAVERRIKASVIALGAGDLPFLLVHTDEKRIRRARETRMTEERITLGELQRELEREIRLDPGDFAPYCDARSTMMILAVFDRTISFEKGLALRRKMGTPETIYILSGHRTAFFYIPYVKRASMDFFNRKLAVPPPSIPGPCEN